MGLAFLGFFWFSGIAVAVALSVRMGGRYGNWLGLGVVLACLMLMQLMHLSAARACLVGNCGELGLLLDQIRLALGGLTLGGAVAGFWIGLRLSAPRPD